MMLRGMTQLELLLQKLDEYISDQGESITRGDAADYAGYQRLVGKLDGLALARRELINIQRAQEENDDDEQH
jgi:hypothetical protein